MTIDCEAAEAGRLLPGELLVQDGVAKLHLCWFAWTLAQWHQCDRLDGPALVPWDALGQRLWGRLQQTTRGRGFDSLPTSARDVAGIRAVLRPAYFSEVIKDVTEPTLKTVAPRFSPTGKETSRLYKLLGEQVVLATWKNVNGLGKGFDRPPKGNLSSLSQFGPAAPGARVFCGSETSVERTCASAYQRGDALTDVQSFGTDSPPCSPVPMPLLIRWGRVLGFGPPVECEAEEEVASERAAGLPKLEAAVWKAFCGAGNGDLRGGTLVEFAEALESLVDSTTTVPEALRQPPFRIAAASRASGRRSDGVQSRRSAPDPPASPLILRAHSSAEKDGISMRVAWDGRVRLADVKYAFCADPDEADERVCLKRLEIEWDWKLGDAVTIDPAWGADDNRYKDAVAGDNPAVDIVEATHDVASFTIRLAGKANGVLAPSPHRAVARLLMPPAKLAVIPGLMHEFSVRARKQDLCLARRDRFDGYRAVEPASPATMDEQVRRSVEIAYTEISNDFPADGRARLLGVRQLEILHQTDPAPRDGDGSEQVR